MSMHGILQVALRKQGFQDSSTKRRGTLLALNATIEVPQKKKGEMSSSRAAS